MNKNEVCQRLDAVCKTLDGGISVRGVQNAGNLAGCFAVIQEILEYLKQCDIVPLEQDKVSTVE